MQNLVVFVEPSEDAYNISLKAGNMILNRLSIDEDAAFELSGVNSLKKSSTKIIVWNEVEQKEKGKENLSYFNSKYSISPNRNDPNDLGVTCVKSYFFLNLIFS